MCSSKLDINKTLIIVGNAKSILDKKYGNQINQFDYVVRLNKFRTKNYESFVGTKTTHVFVNREVFEEYQKPNNILKKQFLINNKNNLKLVYELAKKQNFTNKEIKQEIIIFKENNLFLPEVNEHAEIIKTSDTEIFSTGFQAIRYFVNKGFIPTIVGFDFFQKSGCYWYNTSRLFNEQKLIQDRTNNFQDGHPYKQEEFLFKKMALLKELKIL